MFTTDSRSFCCNTLSCLISSRNSCSYVNPPTILATKKDYSENSIKSKKAPLTLKLSKSRVILQSGIGVVALGFIDAGYSGDWSRIGAISRETEELLKSAAFLVIPFCIFLIFSLSKKDQEG
ncbi:hypothetical protein ACS0TY_024360 [Phlomoides rotata]